MIRLLSIATLLIATLATASLPAVAQGQVQPRDDRFAQPGAVPSFVKTIRSWFASKPSLKSSSEPLQQPTHPEPSQRPRPEPAQPAAAPVASSPDHPAAPAPIRDAGCNGQRVTAAYYWQGTRTASGEAFDPQGMTAAHRTLPFGTRLTVTNPRTGQSVGVTINDRGPFVRGVAIDLSLGAAKAIGMHGIGAVCLS
jgi:rare lipoprotein A (peptidoglycan hydrolase)